MKQQITRERIHFYLWTAGAYLLLWLVVDLARYPESFFQWTVNEIWRVVYLASVIFLFFEYIIPNLSRKKKYSDLSYF